MRLIEIAIGTVLRIPEGWTAFVYRGIGYQWSGSRWAKVGEHNNSVFRVKRA